MFVSIQYFKTPNVRAKLHECSHHIEEDQVYILMKKLFSEDHNFMSTLSEWDSKWCSEIHRQLVSWPITHPFRVPVDPQRDQATDYFKVVEYPMDLQTMKKKLTDNHYNLVQEFVDDFYLICDNAIKFNGQNSLLGYIAADLRTWMEEQYKNKANSTEDEWRKKLVDVVDRLQEHVNSSPEAYSGVGASILSAALMGSGDGAKSV